jgi:hypothetical protein
MLSAERMGVSVDLMCLGWRPGHEENVHKEFGVGKVHVILLH